MDIVDAAWEAGIDAAIVQDLGLLSWCGVVCRTCAFMRPHRSTRTTRLTVRVLSQLGVSRVTLAREVSLEEMACFSEDGGSR